MALEVPPKALAVSYAWCCLVPWVEDNPIAVQVTQGRCGKPCTHPGRGFVNLVTEGLRILASQTTLWFGHYLGYPWYKLAQP